MVVKQIDEIEGLVSLLNDYELDRDSFSDIVSFLSHVEDYFKAYLKEQ